VIKWSRAFYAASFLYLMMVACQSGYEPFLQPDPVSVNQVFMLSELHRFEPILGIGRFVATFSVPPRETYAGWALCNPGGRPPWHVHFNRDWVESLNPVTKRPYMSALVAHEMGHHWVTVQNGSCYDEVAAEACGAMLVAGQPCSKEGIR
jgi:hypothetical protein